ncbi:MAG: ABC transporter substrate-binding protein [Caldilineaceae bacterium]|nr:ABC transporter substrate-binding protein [Caldilineaceae bacterium]
MQQQLSRRGFLRLSTGTAAVLALAACAPAVSGPSGASAPASDTVTLNLWWFEGPIFEAMVKAYEAQHEGVTVNATIIGDIVFGDQKYLTAVAGGTGPDAAVQNRHTFLQFAAKGLYQDVTPWIEKTGLKIEDFTPVQLAESTWDGNIYGLPMFTDVRYLFWNKKHFEEAGLDPEQPPTTWTELEAYAEKLNKFDSSGKYERYGFVPYLWGNSWMWLYGFLNNAPAISEDKRTILADDPKWVETLTWMVNFYDKYVGDFETANAFSQALTSTGLSDPFLAEKASISATGDWFVGDLLRAPDIDWGAAPMPLPPGGVKSTWSCGFSIVMPPSSTHQDAAWDLMQWITTEEGWHARADATLADTVTTWAREQIEGEAQYWPTQACYIPALTMLETDYVSKLGEREQAAWAMGIDALENWTHGCGSEMGVAALEYWVEMDNAARAALAHKTSPEEAMLTCKTKVQEATDRAWAAIDQKA